MGATIRQDKSGIWVVHISGALRKEEVDAIQAAGIKKAGLDVPHPGDDVKLLVLVAEDFQGWVGGEVWNDMTFFVQYGDRIAKIAIVGDPKWESRMLMFTGAGFRRAPVMYFPESQLSEAYDWLG